MHAPFPPSTLLLLAVLLLPGTTLAQAREILIYRCVGKDGALTLRDSPCAAGQTQQTLSMQRPQDPAPAALPPVAPTPAPPAEPRREVQIVYRTPPRPMYECVSPEGERYASDSGEGRTRWVPLWTLGYPLGHGGRDRRPPPAPHPAPLPAALAGAWVRDECHPLPQAEVCARLSDRRYEIIRRYNSAMQSERRELEQEQRGIDARLANDCGGS